MMTFKYPDIMSQKKTKCNVCGKEDARNRIKEHIEINYIEGISLTCTFCKKKNFKSRAALKSHKKNYPKSCGKTGLE